MKHRSLVLFTVVFAALIFVTFTFAQTTGMQQSKTLTPEGEQFVNEAASAGMMEVQLGQLAAKNAQSPEVKEFADRMIKDHGMANEQLKKLVQQKGISLPQEMLPAHQSVVDKLKALTGADFDREYMREMVKDHAKDVAEFQSASEKLQNEDLKGFASKNVPVLEQHLKRAKAIAQKMGIDAARLEQQGRAEAEKKEQAKSKNH